VNINNRENCFLLPNKEKFIDFKIRNINWWKENEKTLRLSRQKYYNDFLHYLDSILKKEFKYDLLNENFSYKKIGELGPGPFGGILNSSDFPKNNFYEYYIDLLMKEHINLRFISWQFSLPGSFYITSPMEDIGLNDDCLDILFSFNTLDHGWDIYKALDECIRISKRCYLSFDCRTEDKNIDLDHYQKVNYEDIELFLINKMKKINPELFTIKKYNIDNNDYPTCLFCMHKDKI
jgi:hypothetical protein